MQSCALSEMSLCTHSLRTSIVHSTTLSRFLCIFSPRMALIVLVITIQQVIWPSPVPSMGKSAVFLCIPCTSGGLFLFWIFNFVYIFEFWPYLDILAPDIWILAANTSKIMSFPGQWSVGLRKIAPPFAFADVIAQVKFQFQFHSKLNKYADYHMIFSGEVSQPHVFQKKCPRRSCGEYVWRVRRCVCVWMCMRVSVVVCSRGWTQVCVWSHITQRKHVRVCTCIRTHKCMYVNKHIYIYV